MDLDAAASADLLLNLWHSLPASAVGRFRRSAFVDTDPGLLQIWMTTGELRVAPHDVYFSVGETVGTPAAAFPDCGLRWEHTLPPVFLPEWPTTRAEPGAPYTTVAHWWGGTVRFGEKELSNDKLTGFLEFARLPAQSWVVTNEEYLKGLKQAGLAAAFEPVSREGRLLLLRKIQ